MIHIVLLAAPAFDLSLIKLIFVVIAVIVWGFNRLVAILGTNKVPPPAARVRPGVRPTCCPASRRPLRLNGLPIRWPEKSSSFCGKRPSEQEKSSLRRAGRPTGSPSGRQWASGRSSGRATDDCPRPAELRQAAPRRSWLRSRSTPNCSNRPPAKRCPSRSTGT